MAAEKLGFLPDVGKLAPSSEVEFVLIGAGLPRTGTMSTFTALEQLLPGRCHHMARVANDQTDRSVAMSADLMF